MVEGGTPEREAEGSPRSNLLEEEAVGEKGTCLPGRGRAEGGEAGEEQGARPGLHPVSSRRHLLPSKY